MAEGKFGQGDSEQDDWDQSNKLEMRTLHDLSTLENGGKIDDAPVFLEMAEDNSMPHNSVHLGLRASSLQGCLDLVAQLTHPGL